MSTTHRPLGFKLIHSTNRSAHKEYFLLSPFRDTLQTHCILCIYLVPPEMINNQNHICTKIVNAAAQCASGLIVLWSE